MVQVLPAVPGFGEKLIDVLGQAGSKVAEGLQRRYDTTALQNLLQQGQKTGQTAPNAAASTMDQINNIATNPQDQSLIDARKNLAATQLAFKIGGKPAADIVGQSLLKQQELEAKQSFEINKEGRARAEKYVEKVSNERNALPDLETSLIRIEDALSSNDLKSFQNWIADRTGDDYLRTSSAAALKSGVKEFFLADLGRIKGGKINQFLENQLSDSYTKAGYDPKANDKIFVAMKSGVDIRRKEIEITDAIKEKFDEKGLPLPSNLENLVYKELRPYVESKEKELISEYKQINSGKGRLDKEFRAKVPEGSTTVVSPNGERGYIPLDQLENALKQGYKAA